MLNKDDLLDSILQECDISAHLATKIPAGGLDYRQSPDQRSNLELLRYLWVGVSMPRDTQPA